MRKHFNQTGFLIAASAVLMVGLADKVRASPISMHNDWDAESGPGRSGSARSDDKAVHSFEHSRQDQGFAVSSDFSLFGPVLPKNPGKAPNVASSNSRHWRDEGLTPTVQEPTPASVPDGGATAVMMGGAVCGLALFGRKLKD